MNRFTQLGTYLFDAACWLLAVLIAAILRYDFDLATVKWGPLILIGLGAALIQWLFGYPLQVYRSRYEKGAFAEVFAITIATVLTGVVGGVLTLLWGTAWQVPRSLVFIATPIALVAMLGIRYATRLKRDRFLRPGADAVPVLLLGAGYVGTHLMHWILNDRDSDYLPVGFIDDDPAKANASVRGVRILGTLKDLTDINKQAGAKVLIVALSNPSGTLLRQVQEAALEANLTVKVMPPMGDVVSNVPVNDLRDLSIDDLLGREVVDTDVAEIAGYLTGKRVLVTGAGGSIGAQLCYEIAKYGPSELIMLDRDETGLQQAQIDTFGTGLLDTKEVVLADIRDSETVTKIFVDREPDVVFHAAALKHLPLLEQYPDEAWKTNVQGTLNVLRAAEVAKVSTFVNISTDKAANPTSILGYSKRAAEKLTASFGAQTDALYSSVRFGNVIGSRGSMLPTFTKLINEGKDLTVTHPDITRYFMTIPEACQLVLQAGGIGSSGEVLILDMGEPVRILDIAKQMISLSGKDINIVFTGLREGEKLHEDLIGEDELADRPYHPKISHTQVKPITPDQLSKAYWDATVRQ